MHAQRERQQSNSQTSTGNLCDSLITIANQTVDMIPNPIKLPKVSGVGSGKLTQCQFEKVRDRERQKKNSPKRIDPHGICVPFQRCVHRQG